MFHAWLQEWVGEPGIWNLFGNWWQNAWTSDLLWFYWLYLVCCFGKHLNFIGWYCIFKSILSIVNLFHVVIKMASCYTGKIAQCAFLRLFSSVKHNVAPKTIGLICWIVHLCFFSPVWVSKCFFRFEAWLNDFWHCAQMWFFSPLWVVICLLRLPARVVE